MPTPAIETLLILQERDRRRRDLEAQLTAVPRDVAAVEGKIAAEKKAIDTAQLEMRELEAKKKVLETEIGSAEQKLGRYRTQQMEVRKNDEYRALGQEIETMQATIGKLEEQELGLMYEIDTARAKFNEAAAVLKANISGHEGKIRTLREREINLKGELVEATEIATKAREGNDAVLLQAYDRTTKKHFPACVPVRGSKCSGCHLKISSEVEGEIRGREARGWAHCDQCGRVVYWES